MRPLSPVNYFRNNKKSFLSSVIAISLSVILVYGLDCFLQSMYRTSYESQSKFYEKAIRIMSESESKLISEELLNKIKQNEYVDKTIPVRKLSIRYNSVGTTTMVPVYGVWGKDRDYMVSKYNIALREGSFPEEGKKEIALDSRVAMNNKLKVGDTWEEYNITGILESDYFLSFSSFSRSKEEKASFEQNIDLSREKYISRYALVFPKEGQYDKCNEVFSDFSKEDVDYLGFNEVRQDFLNSVKNSNQIFDALIILIIIVNVVTLACAKYTQFINRKSEYGILNSLGYSRQEIMNMSLREVILLNFVAFGVGIILAVIFTYLLTKGAFESTGGIMVFMRTRGFLLALLTPLFASIFTLILIFRNLGNMDGISVIEEV